MGDYRQVRRKLRVTTPLGDDALLLKSFSGTDVLSQLFRFRVEMLAPSGTKVPFDALLGQGVTVHLELPDRSEHHLNGLCVKLAEAGRDATFTHYEAELVPDVWKLTRRVRSRIFQQLSVPDILQEALAGFAVDWQVLEKYEARDYCVQYRESDFDFAARLMEEEGIHFRFRHADGAHTLVVTDSHHGYPDLPGESSFVYEELEGGVREDNRVWSWKKEQEVRSTRRVLWDHTFEIPHRHLEAESSILESVPVGAETHRLKLPGTDALELYDWPGDYAKRYAGIDKEGGEQREEVEKIFRDNQRKAEIEMDAEAAPAVVITARTNAKHFLAGYRFSVKRHFNADGDYIVRSVRQSARDVADYRSGKDETLEYECEIACLPAATVFRPPRLTPRPLVRGSQTAVVVGPAGEEIFTDKYGRVKVQFHWHREGRSDTSSSCWVRVASPWAGRQWGAIHLPRVGQEVLVDFLEGDPDRPVIVGSLYNADLMPPYELPANQTQSGIKSRSSPGGGPKNFNEIRFEDRKGKEELFAHAERNLTTTVEGDEGRSVGGNRGTGIGSNDSRDVKGNDTETVKGNQTSTVTGNRSVTIGGTDKLVVGGSRSSTIAAADHTMVGGVESHVVAGAFQVVSATSISLVAPSIVLTAGGTTVHISDGGFKVESGGNARIKASDVELTAASGDVSLWSGGKTEVFAEGNVEVLARGVASIKGKPVKLSA